MSLTAQQRLFAESRHAGLTPKEAAIAAGCPEKTAAQAGSRLNKHPNVIAHMERLRQANKKPSKAKPKRPQKAAVAPDEVAAQPSLDSVPEPPGVYEYIDDPKEFLRQAMNNPLLDPKLQIQAAVALMPYDHAKLGEKGKKEQKVDEAEKIAKGRFSSMPPPTQKNTH